ncbi:hypothetical protein QJS10_CPA09g00660 [Acorus calamus]|uniref:DUF4408 domain-containing protein n=1 Tax=Acorus calamus TaxID=4465 RepID=A0AAV9E2L3_ACOCL|nr:hypothetical protein QJS10_CPA09g00660 [Acorus calamus]
MELKKSLLVNLSIIFAFIAFAPFVSESFRVPYIYLFLNYLIVVLVVDSGVLAYISESYDGNSSTINGMVTSPLTMDVRIVGSTNVESNEVIEKFKKVMEKPILEKVESAAKAHKLTRLPSMPSLFFVECLKEEGFEDMEEEEEVEEEEVFEEEAQELFTKAEMFIGSFYKQLKLQRQESWKKIHRI